MVLTVFEAVEWLSEREVADNIKSGVVIPFDHVNYSPGRSRNLRGQSVDEEVHVRPKQGFLFSQGPVREGVRQEAPYTGMVRFVGVDDGRKAIDSG